ncbi:hypothetical protein YC2023_084660 [Brassica napus]
MNITMRLIQQQQQQQQNAATDNLLTASHAAKLTAGYYNPSNCDGYSLVFKTLKKYSVTVTYTEIKNGRKSKLSDKSCRVLEEFYPTLSISRSRVLGFLIWGFFGFR